MRFRQNHIILKTKELKIRKIKHQKVTYILIAVFQLICNEKTLLQYMQKSFEIKEKYDRALK